MNDWQNLEPTQGEYVAFKNKGKIYVSDFPKGKVMSTVVDDVVQSEKIIYQTSRTQIKATYISGKKQIVELKLQKYEIKDGILHEPPTEIRINSNNLYYSDRVPKFSTNRGFVIGRSRKAFI